MNYLKISRLFLAFLVFVLIIGFIPYSFLGQKVRAAEEGLVGSWHMNEGYGQRILGIVGNRNLQELCFNF